MRFIDVYEEPADDPNEVECPRCESWHDPELPCVPMSAEAEDRRALRQ
jgi:hypothetical protein